MRGHVSTPPAAKGPSAGTLPSPPSEDKAFGCSHRCVRIRDAASPRSPGTATDPGWCEPGRGLPHGPARHLSRGQGTREAGCRARPAPAAVSHWPAGPEAARGSWPPASLRVLSKVQITHRWRIYERVVFPSSAEALESTQGSDCGLLREAEQGTGRAPRAARRPPPLLRRSRKDPEAPRPHLFVTREAP